MYDYIIVGAGLSGCVVARKLADIGKKILIVEKRTHLGGNLYDEQNEDGIIVQKYGPHTFHTNSDKVIEFITKFAIFDNYHLKCEVNIDGIITPSPFNFKTIDQFCPNDKKEIIKEKLLANYPNGRATVIDLLSSNDEDIKMFAKFLFEKDYSLYTSKQWGIKPSEVDSSVLKRVPIEFSYKDNYFYDKFEGIPQNGFMQLIMNLINSTNITTIKNTDAIIHISFKDDAIYYDNLKTNIIYTGQLERLFNNKFGKLPYRSLKFEYEKYDFPSYQSSAIVAYPSHKYKFTRITEYTKLPFQKSNKTIIAKEYPLIFNSNLNYEPYYPIPTDETARIYKLYSQEASKYKNLYILGRLAEYKYYNMDQCILNALNLAENLIEFENERKNSNE